MKTHGLLTSALLALLAFMLASCQAGAPSSPLSVSATINPEPIVGQVVTWRIEVRASGRDMPQTRLQLSLPPGVELVAGQTEYLLDVVKDQPSVVEVSIRVTAAGEWPIDAYTTWPSDPNSQGGFGDNKRLHLDSNLNNAKVIEDVNYPTKVIPVTQMPPDFLTPVTTATP